MLDDDEPEMPEIDNEDSMEEAARKIAREVFKPSTLPHGLSRLSIFLAHSMT
jgi:hypothetical protein